MQIDRLEAIDVHVHIEVSRNGHQSLDDALEDGKVAYFGTAQTPLTVDGIARYYAERNMVAVVFTVDAESATGHPPISNDEIADDCARHPDTLIPFASIDPHRGKAAVHEARRLVADAGVKGFKFHPSLQAFWPTERRFYPLYRTLEDLGVPALFHSGQTGIGSGLHGGGGIRLKYSNPMELDDLAVDFPDLTIICAHPSVPWQDEALAIAKHKPNVYIDLSGWSPRYFPPALVQQSNTLLRDKVLFGSDFPAITPDRWLRDFADLPIRDEVRPLILKTNAARVLGLAP